MARLGALIAGLILVVIGADTFLVGVVHCGGQVMDPGDTCVKTTFGHEVTSRKLSYEAKRRSDQLWSGASVTAGAALILGACFLTVRDIRSRRGGSRGLPPEVGRAGRLARLRSGGRAPGHIRAEVELSPQELADGATKTVEFRARPRCEPCHGTGRADGRRCRSCLGRGLGKRTRRSVTIRIPAGTRPGGTVRVRGKGVPGRYPRPTGDLLLSVRPGTRQGEPSGRPGASRKGERVEPEPAGDTATPVTVTADGVRFTVDAAGLGVQQERRAADGERRWVTHVRIAWKDVTYLEFDADRHDPVVALYAGSDGGRRHIADSRSLSAAQWTEVAGAVQRLSGGRVTLDLSRRDAPRAPRDS